MDENWYAVEQEVRHRLTEARAAARIRTLTRGLHPTARRARWAAVIRLARWVWARAMALPPAHSRSVAKARAATKRGYAANALWRRIRTWIERLPRSRPARGR